MPLRTLTAIRRKIAASLLYSPSKCRTPSLPPELISRILEYTLLTPDPLQLLIATGTVPKAQKRLAKPHLHDMALAKDFHSLCLVSKFFRTEAMSIFFSRNHWQLLVRLYVPTQGRQYFFDDLTHGWRERLLYGVFWVVVHIALLCSPPDEEPMRIVSRVDAVAVLGEEAVGMMRDVKIVVVRYAKMKLYLDVLNETVDALRKGGSLESLVVQYIPFWARDKLTGCVRGVPYDMEDLMEKMGLDEEGSRKEYMDSWALKYWGYMESVLGYVGKVGPMKKAVVCGCVTDEYSFWLEGVIREGVKEGEERVFDRDLEGRKMRGLM